MLKDTANNNILPIVLLFLSLTAFSQNSAITFYPFFVPDPSEGLGYAVQGSYTESVKMEELRQAKRISDIAPGYPANWVSRSAHVEVTGTCHGQLMKASGENDILTPEQKKIISSADANSNIAIRIRYLSSDPSGKTNKSNTINIVLTVVPDMEAEYSGGYVSLITYIKDNIIRKLPKPLPPAFDKVIVKFTVDEKGNMTEVRISRTSGSLALDKFLQAEIHKLPKWKPAKSAEGVKLKQEFEFNLYSKMPGGC